MRQSSLLFDAGTGRQWQAVAGSVRVLPLCCQCGEGRGVSSELTLSLGYNLARSFIHLCAAITSRDGYDLSQHNPLTVLLARHWQTVW